MIKPGTLQLDKTNVSSLLQAKPPTNKTQVRSFLGLCNVYWQFIDKFTSRANPLNQLLKKGEPESFDLNDEQLESFNNLI